MSKNLEEVQKIDKDIEKLQQLKKAAKEKYLEEICPFKLADEITVTGHSHRGKKMIVDVRYMKESWKGEYYWVVRGYIVKKDGSLSDHHIGEVSQFNYKKEA